MIGQTSMADIPLAPQASLFQPQNIQAPLGGFQAQEQAVDAQSQAFSTMNRLFTGTALKVQQISEQQTQADKVIGSNQIQNSIRNLQQDAVLKFPGDYSKQQVFVNQSAQSFLGTFIPAASEKNRSYFKALSTNLLSEANFGYAKNIAGQRLKAQKLSVDNIFEQNLVNTVKAVNNGNSPLVQDNIGQASKSLQQAINNSIITPAEGQVYRQKLLMAVNIAGAKTHIDAALAQGGVAAAKDKFSEVVSDPNNPFLANPKQAASYISQLRSYTNAVTAGARASQAANKDQIKDILNNVRLTGQVPTQKVAQFGIEEKAAQEKLNHDDAYEIWTLPPLARENAIRNLNLGDPNQLSIKQTIGDFDTTYKKNPADFLLGQIAQTEFGTSVANFTPQQSKQARSSIVEIEEQRGDAQINPSTSGEVATVVNAAKTQNVQDFLNSVNEYNTTNGKFSQPGLVQLTRALAKAGIDSSVTDVAHLADPKGKVGTNILANSMLNMSNAKLAVEQRLGISSQKLGNDLSADVRASFNQSNIFSDSDSEKLMSSLKNSAGLRQGEILGQYQKGAERYAVGTVSNGVNPDLPSAIKEYTAEFAKSYTYMKNRYGNYIRIPIGFRNRPVDQNKVIAALKSFQSKINLSKVNTSNVRHSEFTSQALADQRWWNSNGSYTNWRNTGSGESYVLYSGGGVALNWKDTNKPITLSLSTILKGIK